MKVLISETSPQRAAWLHVFGPGPIEVEPAAGRKYRITLTALTVLTKRRLFAHVAARRKLPVDLAAAKIEKRGCTIPASDVIVIEDQGTL